MSMYNPNVFFVLISHLKKVHLFNKIMVSTRLPVTKGRNKAVSCENVAG